ncbi:MAG: DUF4760 domain-containing protein [Novosphingobium sp.]|nr:DUF4760 domain-containing protein [Novosphingobium sp.]
MPAVGLLSLLVTAVIALLALRNTRSVARQKATLDLIEKRESTEHYRSLSRNFFDLQKGPGFMHLVDPVEKDKAARKAVFDYLNHYEIVSIGIRQDILDEKIYRAWMEGAFVRDWNAAAEFIQRERWKIDEDGNWSYRDSIYENYMHVACKWSPDAIKLDESFSDHPSQPEGYGDDKLPDPTDDIELKN